MAEAMVINRWMRATVVALRGALDSYEYARGSGDETSAAMLLAVAAGFVEEPWHVFMRAVPGWSDEVERYQGLRESFTPPSSPERQDVQIWTDTYWGSAELQAATQARVEAHRVRRRGDAKDT